ncbi:N-acetylglucosamine kinase [uncultured Microbacterium sp.]|uniref:N-acetylglucosamine kinase n=1 Tax=uncultured Microbacterium sp. TaxID=191216 RepID=UPI0025F015AC|nr:BadF/BadG/BcrA/BcrD ATPase family protein [uncultured Microbacterium sp.]
MTSSGTVSVDLGKSLCRVRASVPGRNVRREGPGAPGLAGRDGVSLALAAIRPLLADLDATAPARIGVGAAGAMFAPVESAVLAEELARIVGAPAAVASDVVTAHAGALQGEAGVLLIAGTGAVALGVDAEGYRLVDGWGPELGDLGSGSWIGREGLRAVLRARDGLAGRTTLTDAFGHLTAAEAQGDAARVADPTPITWVGGSDAPARQIARFAPAVLDAADAGDPAAVAIRDEAARLLAETARAASAREGAGVVLHGGLTAHAGFRARIVAALAARGQHVRDARGDALDGAAMIAEQRAPLHERFVHRAL